MKKNSMHLEFDAISENEGFARVTVAAFATQIDPTVNEIADIKVCVSEAVTNAVVHAYRDNEKEEDKVYIDCELIDNSLTVIISDKGCGIEDIEQAMQPTYTSRPEEERSGFGFTFMQMFMDDVVVESKVGEGTTVRMTKQLGENNG